MAKWYELQQYTDKGIVDKNEIENYIELQSKFKGENYDIDQISEGKKHELPESLIEILESIENEEIDKIDHENENS